MKNDTATGKAGFSTKFALTGTSTDESKEQAEFRYICQLFDIKINAGFKDICCF